MTTYRQAPTALSEPYMAPSVKFSVSALNVLRKKSPELFTCSLCGDALLMPDSGPCGFCSVEHGESEPAFQDRDESQTKAPHALRAVVVLA